MGDSASDSGSSRTIKEEDIGIDIRPLASKDGILIKVQPQQEPKTSNRAPIDLVLAVSVSKSMQTEAPAPVDEKQVAERFGLTVLDLVKHACLTILKTLEEGDRLAIVIIAGTAQVLQPLTAQHKRAKGLSGIFLEGLRLLANMLGPTNMWDGVQKGLELLQTGQDETYRVPALMLLTDGMDDYMPQEGWLPKLKSMGPPLAPIHTFGFGYNVKSGPLKSISEFSGGRYTYIPDSDMIATVLIHSMANIQSTTATEARLTIKGNHLKLLSPFGSAVRLDQTSQSSSDPNNSSIYRIDIPLGSIQFGQSRDIYLAYERPPPEDCIIEAELTFRNLSGNYRQVGIKHRAVDFADLSPAEVAYHISRAQICRFLSSLFPTRASTGDLFHGLHSAEHTFPLLKADIDARLFPDDPDCASLMADLEGAPPHGQISLALRHEHQFRWGGHYLLSLLDAHANQVCNSYKDAGPQRYGRNSPFFKRCRDALEAAFDDVEAPRPSIDVHETFPPPAPWYAPERVYKPSTTTFISVPDLAHRRKQGYHVDSYTLIRPRFNQSSNPCFAGTTMVRLAGDGGVVPISQLRTGVSVATPAGPRPVEIVLKTSVHNETMVRLPGGVLVTPWHPVKMGGGGAEWMLPAAAAAAADGQADGKTTYSGFTYSLLLQEETPSGDGREDPIAAAEQHAFCVGSDGIWGVALGHGIVEGSDVRAHRFFGDRDACICALAMLSVYEGGVVTSAGTLRSMDTGKVIGFRMLDDGDETAARRGVAARVCRTSGCEGKTV